MTTQRAMNYAKALMELNIAEESINSIKNLLDVNDVLLEALSNPTIKNKEKTAVIDSIFQNEVRGFIKVLCENNSFDLIFDILDAYQLLAIENKNLIKATLTYVTKPEKEQLQRIKEMIIQKWNKAGVILELKEDTNLLGGFILTVGDKEYDKSIRGILSGMQKTLLWR